MASKGGVGIRELKGEIRCCGKSGAIFEISNGMSDGESMEIHRMGRRAGIRRWSRCWQTITRCPLRRY